MGVVSNLIDGGYRVVFEKKPQTGQDLGLMVNKSTGVTFSFRRERHVWVLDAFMNLEGQNQNSNGD